MKKLLVLMLVLTLASLVNAVPIMNLVWNSNNTFGIEVPLGMSGAHDWTGVYFVITGVEPDSGILSLGANASILTLSSANEGDAGDTGLFPYGVGTYGEFRATNVTYVASGGLYANGYVLLPGATTSPCLYTLDDSMIAATLVAEILIPEPATIALLCLGGLMLRRRK